MYTYFPVKGLVHSTVTAFPFPELEVRPHNVPRTVIADAVGIEVLPMKIWILSSEVESESEDVKVK